MTAAERPGPQITDEDVYAAAAAIQKLPVETNRADEMWAALESTLRPSGLGDRHAADLLDRFVEQHRRGGAVVVPLAMLTELAADWWEGKR